MKISWGVRIALVYIIFVVALVAAVIVFINEDVHLVTDEYYAKELVYQHQIDKINRTNNLTEQLIIITEKESIHFNFPKIFRYNDLSGSIYFYRPSDSDKDFVVKIKPDSSNTQSVPTESLEKGLWKLKVEWYAKDISYYNEKILMIN